MALKITVGFGFEKDGNGRPFPGTPQDKATAAVVALAGRYGLGGWSLSFNRLGGWTNDGGEHIVERGGEVVGYIPGTTANSVCEQEWRLFAKALAAALGQTCVVFAVESVESFEMVTP